MSHDSHSSARSRAGSSTTGSMTAHADPNSGPAPGDFDVVVQGGTPPYTVDAFPSPPNPSPMPDVRITGLHVEILDEVAPDTPLYFKVTDSQGQTANVAYQVTS